MSSKSASLSDVQSPESSSRVHREVERDSSFKHMSVGKVVTPRKERRTSVSTGLTKLDDLERDGARPSSSHSGDERPRTGMSTSSEVLTVRTEFSHPHRPSSSVVDAEDSHAVTVFLHSGDEVDSEPSTNTDAASGLEPSAGKINRGGDQQRSLPLDEKDKDDRDELLLRPLCAPEVCSTYQYEDEEEDSAGPPSPMKSRPAHNVVAPASPPQPVLSRTATAPSPIPPLLPQSSLSRTPTAPGAFGTAEDHGKANGPAVPRVAYIKPKPFQREMGNPGPGAYDLGNSIGAGRKEKWSMQGKLNNELMNKKSAAVSPGPAYYQRKGTMTIAGNRWSTKQSHCWQNPNMVASTPAPWSYDSFPYSIGTKAAGAPRPVFATVPRNLGLDPKHAPYVAEEFSRRQNHGLHSPGPARYESPPPEMRIGKTGPKWPQSKVLDARFTPGVSASNMSSMLPSPDTYNVPGSLGHETSVTLTSAPAWPLKTGTNPARPDPSANRLKMTYLGKELDKELIGQHSPSKFYDVQQKTNLPLWSFGKDSRFRNVMKQPGKAMRDTSPMHA